MNKYKVSHTLQSNIENVLKRRSIPYALIQENEVTKCATSISSDSFHKIVVRAKMEKEQEEQNSLIPFVANTELNDFNVLDEIGGAYVIR